MSLRTSDHGGGGGNAPSLAEVAANDEQFRLLAENIPTLCWMADPDGYIFWYNRRWHEYCGTTPEEMEGWGWQSVHDPALLDSVLARWRGSIETGDRFEMIFPLRGADGVFRPFLTRVEPYRGVDGAVLRWFGMNTDISAQIDAEARLTATNTQLQAIIAEREATLSQLGEGVIVTDREGNITFVNKAAERLHGVARLDVPPDEYSGAYSLFTEAGEPHPVETLPLTRAVRGHEQVVDAHWRIRRPDGTEILAIGNARPIYRADGAISGAVLTIRDDTRRRAVEAALADAVEVKDILLHEVNHRVKNSLQLVTSLLMLQAGKTSSTEVRQSLLDARSRVSVVAGMHQRLYTTSQHDRVDLSVYLRDLAADTVAALNAEGRIDFRFDSPHEVVLPLDQAVPLAMVVSELLSNSLKYAFNQRDSGSIAITVGCDADDIRIVVKDDGDGLPAGFEPAGSHGLGMRIVTALVKQMRARIETPPQAAGATFVITVPRKDMP